MKHRSAHLVLHFTSLAALAGCGAAEATSDPVSATVDGDTRITLDRSACYGSCPVYSLKIAGDGAVTYSGQAYVKVHGAASARLEVSDVQGLVDQFLRADYFELSVPEACPGGIFSDAPGARTSLTLGDQTHVVDHYHGNSCAPAILDDLEQAIDNVAGSAQWVVCDAPGGACCDPNGNPFLSPCN